MYAFVKCPIVGQYFCVNSPSKAPLRPEGGGVVGQYIDRCITQEQCSYKPVHLRMIILAVHVVYMLTKTFDCGINSMTCTYACTVYALLG